MTESSSIPRAPFGRTGHLSSRVIFGAAALMRADPDTAQRVLEQVADAGVNHLDTAARYGDAEVRMAPWLAGHRDEVFLATKTAERSGTGARAGLEASLSRLGVDQVDLIQLHNLVEPEEWTQAFAPDGAVAALGRARDEGLCRFIGVTGHGLRIPGMHLRSLAEFDFDSVLFPYNASLLGDPGYRTDVELLRALCVERNVAVQTIKSLARRRWSDRPDKALSWYEPITDPEAIGRAVRFVLAEEQLFLNTTSDHRLLSLVLDAAAGSLERPTDDELAADDERLGITPLFDGADLERI